MKQIIWLIKKNGSYYANDDRLNIAVFSEAYELVFYKYPKAIIKIK